MKCIVIVKVIPRDNYLIQRIAFWNINFENVCHNRQTAGYELSNLFYVLQPTSRGLKAMLHQQKDGKVSL